MGNWLSTESNQISYEEERYAIYKQKKDLELRQQYKYDVYGKFQCPTIKHDHSTHPIKRTLVIFYEFVHGSVQTDHTLVHKTYHGISFDGVIERLCTMRYKQNLLNYTRDLYVRRVSNTFDEFLHAPNARVSVVYNIIDTANLLPIIIPRFIAVTNMPEQLCKEKNIYHTLYFEINYDTQITDFYIYKYCSQLNIRSYNEHRIDLVCKDCHALVSSLDNAHCCNCKIGYTWRNGHCCKCKMEYDSNTQTHCCSCMTIYNIGQSHCCKCKINVDESHCGACHVTHKGKYHCCACNVSYDKFNHGCKICSSIGACNVCGKTNLVPAENFRAVCNKQLICAECCIVIQSASSPSCPFCKNTDIKGHILFD